MKIGTIKSGLDPLLDDAYESEKLLEQNRDSQFARRVYVRSIFAFIEGSIWILKQVCLKAHSIDGKRKISLQDFAILTEESYDLKNNGDIKVSVKNINLLDNIKFTFKTVNKYFNGNIDLGTGTENWNKLVEAKRIRNRITHPKSEIEMEISHDEIKICEEVCSWYNELIHKCFLLFLETSTKGK